MALTKIKDGRVVELSPEEEAAILAEWDANDPAKKVTGYRELRKAAYIKELGKAPGEGFENAVGDMLDMLITQSVATAQKAGAALTPELEDQIAKIAAIKQRFPKA